MILNWDDEVPPEGSVVRDSSGRFWDRVSDYPVSWQRQYDDGTEGDVESWIYVCQWGPIELISWGYDD